MHAVLDQHQPEHQIGLGLGGARQQLHCLQTRQLLLLREGGHQPQDSEALGQQVFHQPVQSQDSLDPLLASQTQKVAHLRS